MKKVYLLLLPVALFTGTIAHAQSAIIRTIAGTGIAGFAGDGQAAFNSKFDTMGFIAVDNSDNIYVADAQNNRIRKIDKTTGAINTIAGTGVPGWTGDYGLAIYAEIYYPFGIAVDDSSNVYFTDNGNGIVRKINQRTGIINRIAGTGNGGFTGDDSAALNATFVDPTGITVDAAHNVYISDDITNTVRMVSAADSNIYLYAGNGTAGFSGDGGLATVAELHSPEGISIDKSGNLYIADEKNYVIRQVSASGMISTVAGIPGNNTITVANGTATAIPLGEPIDVAADIYGNIFISDVGTDVIRVANISSNSEGVIAGNGISGFSGDGGLATDAELNYPIAVAVDDSSHTFIGDLLNFRIRTIGNYVTAVPEISVSSGFSIYPDPATATLNILFPAGFNSFENSIEIIDVTGKTLSSVNRVGKPNAVLSIDITSLASGMYFVKISGNANTTQQVCKFIKE